MEVFKKPHKERPAASRSSVITGALAALVILAAAGMIYRAFFPGKPGEAPGGSQLSPAATSTSPAPSAPPRVTLVIEGSGRSRRLVVQWSGLPQGTDALNVFRGKTGTPTEGWSLWKTISVAPGLLAEGTSSIFLGNGSLAGYSFYVQAVGTGNGNATGTGTGTGTSGSSGNQTVMWTSGITEPATATSTASTSGTNSQGSLSTGTGTATGTSSTATTTATSSTTTTATASTSVSSSSGSTSSGGASYPNGIPYYNPQAQITAYGTTSVNFSVQHVNQSIQMEWRDLPTSTNLIVISRSPSSSGPWSQLLAQNNPGTTGSYSLSLVDGTLNDPYYYLLVASQNSSTLATYGPVYLPPQQ